YVGSEYSLAVLPGGFLQPWEGHWIYVVPGDPRNLKLNLDKTPQQVLTLIVPPVGASGSRAVGARSRAATQQVESDAPRVAGSGSWAIRLVAQAKDLADSHNYIGMSTRATEGEDVTKVPKPPIIGPFVSLGIVRPNSPAGLYQQDLRPVG